MRFPIRRVGKDRERPCSDTPNAGTDLAAAAGRLLNAAALPGRNPALALVRVGEERFDDDAALDVFEQAERGASAGGRARRVPGLDLLPGRTGRLRR